MILKDTKRYRLFSSHILSLLKKENKIIIYTLFVFISGIMFHRTGMIGELIIPNAKSISVYFMNVFKGALTNEELITLDIKHKDFQYLSFKREQALSYGKLISSEDDYVPAILNTKNKMVKVAIRLKGDWANQFIGQKWSFRVKVKNGDTVFGMRRFSLHHPKERNFIWEMIYHKMLSNEGLISLRYKFIRLKLNGKDLGIYALEEHFTKYLIENNKNREAPIIKFSESNYWSGANLYPSGFHDVESYTTAGIEAFELNSLRRDTSLFEKYKRGVFLLGGFRDGSLTTSQVFDVEKLAKYLAITDLLGAYHGNRWHNKRFYINPVNSKIEPIGYDGMAGYQINSLSMHAHRLNKKHHETIFSDKKLFKSYVKHLKRVSSPTYIDSFFIENQDDIDHVMKIIYQEFPSYQFNRDVILKNGKYIRKITNPEDGLDAFLINNNSDSLELKIINKQTMPLVVKNIFHGKTVLVNEEKFIRSKILSSHVSPYNYKISNKGLNEINPDSLIISYSVLGDRALKTKKIKDIDTFDWNVINTDFQKLKQNFRKNEFLIVNEKTKKIFFKEGTYKLKESLIIPEGYEVISNGNLKLDLINSSKFVSYSPLLFEGSQDSPIIIFSSDSSGEGLAVLNAKGETIFDNVSFSNLVSFSEPGWDLTGAITIYESSVTFQRCIFKNNKSEDALNCFNNNVKLANSIFIDNASDDFDGDFVTGTIINCEFNNPANDAIDISGSKMDFTNVTIDGFGDKGLSLGENSFAKTQNIIIKNGEIGLACKDFSKITGNLIYIENCSLGITSFQKKSEFGPSEISLLDVSISNCSKPLLIENNSEVFINSEYVTPNTDEVKNLLYGNLYGKKSS